MTKPIQKIILIAHRDGGEKKLRRNDERPRNDRRWTSDKRVVFLLEVCALCLISAHMCQQFYDEKTP